MSMNPNAQPFVPAENAAQQPTSASASQMAMAREYGNTQARVNANATEVLEEGAKSAATIGNLGTLLLGGVAGFASGVPAAFASIYNTSMQTALQDKYLDREWKAAQSIGLASPSQFGTNGADMAVKRFAGAVRGSRSTSGSVYSV